MSFLKAIEQGYRPTVLASMADTKILWDLERDIGTKSECYERAHIWARALHGLAGINSMKAFMFFTDSFRNTYYKKGIFGKKIPYAWWFHVAPFVYVRTKEIVLDRAYSKGPRAMNDWTYSFIAGAKLDNDKVKKPTREEALCLDSVDFNDYDKKLAPANYHCILRKVPMYNYRPVDVKELDCDLTKCDPTKEECTHNVLTDFRRENLADAYDKALP